jgi:hypothetical protein
VNAANRLLGVAVGLVLLALGVLGILAGSGLLPGVDPDGPVLSDEFRTRWHEWGGWAVAGTIAAGVLVALLGLWLMLAERRRPGGRTLADLVWRTAPDTEAATGTGQVDTDATGTGQVGTEATGHVHVGAAALNRALTRDLQAIPAVDRARVHLTGRRDQSQLRLRLRLASDADLTELHRHVDAVLHRFAATTGLRPEVGDVDVQIADRAASRVR